jgi:hypothetical protein
MQEEASQLTGHPKRPRKPNQLAIVDIARAWLYWRLNRNHRRPQCGAGRGSRSVARGRIGPPILLRLFEQSLLFLACHAESGEINHTVFNKTSEPMVHVLFEILAADLKGPSLIPVKHH